MKAWVLGAAMLVAVAPAAAQAPVSNDDAQVKARQRISTMEAVLERAVQNGANNMLRQVRGMPDAPMLSGVPQVRGFRLDGYGVFFDVGVPLLRLPIMWTVRHIMPESSAVSRTVADLREAMRHMSAPDRERMEPVLRRLEMQVAVSRVTVRPQTAAATSLAPLPGADVAPPPVAPDTGILDDPNEAYTREIKAALIDAMLENGSLLEIGANEWFTVAARDNVPRDPLIPTDITDYSTVVFRVRGADLLAFRQGRLTIEDARARIEVREY